VTYDKPVDYGIHAFCSLCQVCVNRCPGRALMREKVWWRGTEKHKLVYKRCLPVMARYESCGACMKVCPIQRYGMNAVMDHYAATGQVLGKGTHLLEGFSLRGMGYFGPGELPSFDKDFFKIPYAKSEDVAFQGLKEKIKAGEVPDNADGDAILRDFKEKVGKYINVSPDNLPAVPDIRVT
jgi:NAD-dependent dihydropyrimidine dehydrogenase PreA subunit